MHVAMLKAHNRLVDRLREDGVSGADLGAEARRALTWHYQWTVLFDVHGEPRAARARPIDGCLPESLLRLPVDITGELEDENFESLAMRDLQRGVATGLPSGEAVARFVGEEPLRAEEVGLTEFGWSGETPLWYYLLKEAEAREDGERLGPVGSLIVGEVLLGIVDGDPESFRSVDPSWRPTLPRRT